MLKLLIAIALIGTTTAAVPNLVPKEKEPLVLLRKKSTLEIPGYTTYIRHHPKEVWLEFKDSKGKVNYATIADSTLLEGKTFPCKGERTMYFGGAFSLADIEII